MKKKRKIEEYFEVECNDGSTQASSLEEARDWLGLPESAAELGWYRISRMTKEVVEGGEDPA